MNKLIKTWLAAPAAALTMIPMVATAYDTGAGYSDYADVIEARPQYRQVQVDVPSQQCWNEDVVHYESYGGGGSGSVTPEIVGGIIGGVIGHQFGGGSGKKWATGAGAVLGGSIGHDVKNRRSNANQVPVHDTVQRCKTVHEYHTEQQRDGYLVRYVYNGQEFETRMPYDPGTRMRVQVTVTPAEGG